MDIQGRSVRCLHDTRGHPSFGNERLALGTLGLKSFCQKREKEEGGENLECPVSLTATVGLAADRQTRSRQADSQWTVSLTVDSQPRSGQSASQQTGRLATDSRPLHPLVLSHRLRWKSGWWLDAGIIADTFLRSQAFVRP